MNVNGTGTNTRRNYIPSFQTRDLLLLIQRATELGWRETVSSYIYGHVVMSEEVVETREPSGKDRIHSLFILYTQAAQNNFIFLSLSLLSLSLSLPVCSSSFPHWY